MLRLGLGRLRIYVNLVGNGGGKEGGKGGKGGFEIPTKMVAFRRVVSDIVPRGLWYGEVDGDRGSLVEWICGYR